MRALTLIAHDLRLSVCRLPPDSKVPNWAHSGAFTSITRTPDELSIVCDESAVLNEVTKTTGFRTFKLQGPFDFALTGILASVAGPLAEAGVAIFAISTYDTDWVLVREAQFGEAASVLEAAGHWVIL